MILNRRDLLKRCLGVMAAVPFAGRLMPKSDPVLADPRLAHPLLKAPDEFTTVVITYTNGKAQSKSIQTLWKITRATTGVSAEPVMNCRDELERLAGPVSESWTRTITES